MDTAVTGTDVMIVGGCMVAAIVALLIGWMLAKKG